MIKNIFSFIILMAIHSSLSFAVEDSIEQDLYIETSLLKNRVLENNSLSDSQEIIVSSWPNTRPFGTPKTITIEEYSDSYELYIWWEQGNLFAEAVPLNGSEPFICGSGWSYVQNIGSVVTVFDTVRFENSDGYSVCDEFTSPTIFAITQWEYIFDYYVDFNKPFNLVSSRNPYDLVRINNGITLTTPSTPSSSKGTISPDLTITIPAITYQSLSETADINLTLKYNGNTAGGLPTWVLLGAGYNE